MLSFALLLCKTCCACSLNYMLIGRGPFILELLMAPITKDTNLENEAKTDLKITWLVYPGYFLKSFLGIFSKLLALVVCANV